jgi:hypothetical protein
MRISSHLGYTELIERFLSLSNCPTGVRYSPLQVARNLSPSQDLTLCFPPCLYVQKPKQYKHVVPPYDGVRTGPICYYRLMCSRVTP